MILSAITDDRLDNLRRAIRRTQGLYGLMAELGVYRGGSALVICQTRPHTMLHLFDTFKGMPADEEVGYDPDGYVRKGMFEASEETVRQNLAGYPVEFHAGLFPEDGAGPIDGKYVFVHIDCDLYRSAADAIGWFWPRMVPGGIMFFDDYGCKFTGVTTAVQEAFTLLEIEEQFDRYGNQIGCLVVKA